jgi:hypothetical protein
VVYQQADEFTTRVACGTEYSDFKHILFF